MPNRARYRIDVSSDRRIGDKNVGVVKLVDAWDSKSRYERSVGSIPTARTNNRAFRELAGYRWLGSGSGSGSGSKKNDYQDRLMVKDALQKTSISLRANY